MGYDVNESLEATNVVVVSDFGELPPPFFLQQLAENQEN